MGKGSARRPTNEVAFQNNWDAIFGSKKKQATPGPSPEGNDCGFCLEGFYEATEYKGQFRCNSCQHTELFNPEDHQ